MYDLFYFQCYLTNVRIMTADKILDSTARAFEQPLTRLRQRLKWLFKVLSEDQRLLSVLGMIILSRNF